MKDLLVGVDAGTSACKTVLLREDGSVIARASQEYATRRPGAVLAEQDPEDWWKALTATVHHVLDQHASFGQRVAGIGVSSHGPSALLLDDHCHPLHAALMWMDRRAEVQCRAIEAAMSDGKVPRINPNQVDPTYALPKLLWLKENEPELYRQARHALQGNGYLVFLLSGALTMDMSQAGLYHNFDLRELAWNRLWSEAFDICHQLLPELHHSGDSVGYVTSQAAAQTGLPEGTPVVAGGLDTPASALGAGVVGPGLAYHSAGQAGSIGICVDHPVDAQGLVCLPYVLPRRWMLEGAMTSTGAALRWFRDQFNGCERPAAQDLGLDAFELLTLEAGKAEPGAGGLVFLPYMAGERSPIWNSNARGVIFGLSLATTRCEFVRMILEGAAYALRHNVETAGKAGVPIHEMIAVGGGARSAVWNQIKADVTGVPVRVPEHTEGAAVGVAMLAGIATGIFGDEQHAAQRVVSAAGRYEPRAEFKARYDALFGIYLCLYERLREQFDVLGRTAFRSSGRLLEGAVHR